jgi:hypothetical protein
MRQEDINALKEPYPDSRVQLDRRFHSSIGADVPSAGVLVREIFNDLNANTFGISWWQSTPVQERILIGDYLYQCADSIEVNLVEAKLHYMEWLDVRDRQDARLGNVVSRTPQGELKVKHPPSLAPIDDLPNKLEGMHICGFFRAIGSSLDCLASVMVGILGLNTSLRWSDIGTAEGVLKKLTPQNTPSSKVQIDFRDLFETAKKGSGPEDWLAWASQYRNMFVHRGRRLSTGEFVPRETLILDARERIYPRVKTQLHLAKYPDKSDVEAFIRKDVSLNEDADITFRGVFKSTRDFEEIICERLVSIWSERRNDPSLIEQPPTQWNTKIKPCKFSGYDKNAPPLSYDEIMGNPTLHQRMWAAAVFDQHRSLWANSPWNQ